MFTRLKPFKKHIIGLVPVVALFAFFVFRQPASADELLRKAREQKLKAMHESCEVIGEKLSSCYGGNREDCKSLQESNAWFTNEYGQYPELACTTDDPFFVTGAK
jgi:hypothetical protein